MRWREEEGGARRVPLCVPQRAVAELYYGCCALIDRHNRCRQDVLQQERKVGTHDWSMRVNITLLGICVVDAWLLYRGPRGAAAVMSQAAFYEQLASGHIDNDFHSRGLHMRTSGGTAAAAPETTTTGVGIHLTHTSKRRRGSYHLAQRNCRLCKTGRTTLICSTFKETGACTCAGRGLAATAGPRTSERPTSLTCELAPREGAGDREFCVPREGRGGGLSVLRAEGGRGGGVMGVSGRRGEDGRDCGFCGTRGGGGVPRDLGGTASHVCPVPRHTRCRWKGGG